MLFGVGLALRLPGLLFNGMYDLDQMVLLWGSNVAQLGIGKAFAENYGFLSYLAFGGAATIAEHVPRFWWAPYKAMELSAEIGVLAVLVALVPAPLSILALSMYWLNPWFILHGAWHGFWDGPYVLAALLGVLCLRRFRGERFAWAAFGACLATSGMFKPQGLFQIAAPIGIYLVLDLLRNRSAALLWFVAGCLAVLAASTAFLVAFGADPLVIPRNYLGAAGAMPNLCNDCLNVWHPVVVLLQRALGQHGATFELSLPGSIQTALHVLAAVVTLGSIGIFSWMLSARQADAQRSMPRHQAALSLMVFAALMISSFGTMAHINHGLAALVFAIPLAAGSRRLRSPWIALVAIAWFAHLATFGIGRAQVLPEICVDYMWSEGGCDQQFGVGVMTPKLQEYEHARPLLARIQHATTSPRQLTQLQARVRRLVVSPFADGPLLSLLSAAQAIAAVVLIRELIRSVRRSEPD